MIGLSVLMVVFIIQMFSKGQDDLYCLTGIVADISSTSNGFTFDIHTSDGVVIRCFSHFELVENGYYALSGDYSSDGSIFFVDGFRDLDVELLHVRMVSRVN